MIKSILLAVDGSTYTDSQVKHCVQLARAFEAKVHVLTVVDIRMVEWAVVLGTDGFVPVTPSAVYKNETLKILDEKADAVLAKCESILKEESILFTADKIQGPPVDVICEKNHLVDMLIIGHRGEFAKWRRKLSGATLDAVVRQWSKPICVTQKTYRPINRLLFAYDGSEKANKALQLAAVFASRLKLPLSVLTVNNRERARKRCLREAAAYLEPYGITLELIGGAGTPEKEIIRITNENKIDMTIIGAFGHSRIREAILGSTTEHVLRGISTPLLLSK
jgi:nucleotide-binding universal stress UspA family protein